MKGEHQRFNMRRVVADDSASVKLCGGCNRRLAIEKFWANRASHDGLATRCRECSAAQYRRTKEVQAREEMAAMECVERCDLCTFQGRTRRGPFILIDGTRVCAKHLKKRVKERLGE